MAHADLEHALAADRARALALCPVSREIAERLDRLVAVLLRWQKTTNLVGDSTVHSLWTRHIADSLQLLALAPEARIFIDLGSGAGFPGLVIACALAETPGAMVHLVEANGKKTAFLREAVRATGAPAQVHAMRIERFLTEFSGHADIVTARALAPLMELLAYAEPLLKSGAKALFLKGQDIDDELTQASKCWKIEYSLVRSKTSEQGFVLIVRGAERIIRVQS